MTRKKSREHVFEMMFCIDFHQNEDLVEQATLYLDNLENASQKAKNQLMERFQAVLQHVETIDGEIQDKAKGWTLQRLAKADVSILRLAIYEMLFDEEVPNGVAINEAVELAKKYGTEKSPAFINGLLATIAKEHPDKEMDAQEKEQ